MLRLLAAYVGLSLCAPAQESALVVYLSKVSGTPASVLQAMSSETSRVLTPLEMAVRWRDADSPQDDDGQLVMVRFSGACSFAEFNPSRSAQPKAGEPLASTSITNGRILPFVTIHCSKVRDRIAPFVVGLKGAERDVALGRAIGRLLAHEIYHVLSGERKHSHAGVAAAYVSTRDLLAERFDLDSESLAQMRPSRPELPDREELEAEPAGRD